VVFNNDHKHDWRGHAVSWTNWPEGAHESHPSDACLSLKRENDTPKGADRNTVYSIIAQFQQEYRGLVEYYHCRQPLPTQPSQVGDGAVTGFDAGTQLRLSMSEVYAV